MADPILDSRGYFWPAGLTTPSGHFAPPVKVPGRLTVGESGRIELDLDAPLPAHNPDDHFRRLLQRGPVEGWIDGILVGTDEHVRIGGLISNGGSLHPRGPSGEGYIAHRCLIGPEPFAHAGSPTYRWLDLPLDGFEQWLGLENIAVKVGTRGVTARYRRPKARAWRQPSATLTLRFELSGGYRDKMSQIRWQERAVLSFSPRAGKFDVEAAAELTGRIEDLLILLTDSNRGVGFPRLRAHRRARAVRLYYPRTERGQAPIKWNNCWVSYRQCEPMLGDLLEAWLHQHETFGPGFHLYLGNRRASGLYPEHRFASFVWGLESLHRALHPPTPNAALARKVERILSAIPPGKDRDWAARMLPVEDEPALATRIAQLVGKLPLDFGQAELAAFGRRCGQRRNDVSHFGGMREPDGYDVFLDEIQTLSSALDLLYHALLLQQIGVPDSVLQWWFVDGHSSYWMSKTLEAAGLHLAKTARAGRGPST